MKKNIQILLKTIFLSLLFGVSFQIKAQYCVTGCNSNTYVNSVDPNTIEYDNLISVFHASFGKEKDGTFKVWGQGSGSDGISDLLAPTVIAPGTGTANFNYTGTPLKVAAGSSTTSHQFALLTTDGLYIWGTTNILISSSIKNTTAFAKISVNGKSDGLPTGVNPSDVKMMFGSYLTLTIVTCTGEAWVLSANGSKNGDGTTQNTTNNVIWHRVKTSDTGNPNLSNVVALRGTPNALFALTSTGKLYTWGTGTYINNGASSSARVYATELSAPSGVTTKMIGMTQNGTAQTYYLLSTDGRLYAMGDNSNRQIGDGTTTTRNNWAQVIASNTINSTTYNLNNNIVWISPNEHSDYANSAAINVLTNDNKQWAWGANSGNMIGAATSGNYYNPIFMPGNSTDANGLALTDEVIAVETGGHTTINVKKCSQNFGYVGHKISGSMGDGTSTSGNPNTFSYSTSILIVCGTDLGPKVQELKICEGTKANLNNANLEINSSEVEWHATNDASSPIMTDVTNLNPGTYYAFFSVASGKCRLVGSIVIVSYYQAGDSGYGSCPEICTEPIDGNAFGWSYNSSTTYNGTVYNNGAAADASQVEQTFMQPASDYGFELNIYRLDNSFNMKVNGVSLTTQEIQFQSSQTQNIRFKSDGALWENGGVSSIWSLTGNEELPIVRVKIGFAGDVTFWGKRNNDANAVLEELELFNGNQLNAITWNNSGSNTIIVGQTVVGNTNMIGNGHGLKIVPCACYNAAATPGTGAETKVGITLLKRAGADSSNNWPMIRKSGHIALESNTKGFVITRMSTIDIEGQTTPSVIAPKITNPQDGMMVYDTDVKCLKIYSDGVWKCFSSPACP